MELFFVIMGSLLVCIGFFWIIGRLVEYDMNKDWREVYIHEECGHISKWNNNICKKCGARMKSEDWNKDWTKHKKAVARMDVWGNWEINKNE